jgi:hypothetical protein
MSVWFRFIMEYLIGAMLACNTQQYHTSSANGSVTVCIKNLFVTQTCSLVGVRHLSSLQSHYQRLIEYAGKNIQCLLKAIILM